MSIVKVVSDLICPWCYIGKRRLEASLRKLSDDSCPSVSWHPFQLNPDIPDEGMDRKEYCRRKFGSWERCEEMFVQIASVGQTVGIEFHFEKQTTIPNTFIAHRLIWLAGKEGVQDAVVEALFEAYFCDGVDLSIPSEIVEVCVAAGLDPARLERFLASEEGAAEVRGEEQEIKSLGISAVPLFIIQDRVAVSGAQPPETLVRAFKQAQRMRRKQHPSTREKVRTGCEPEGCKI